LRRSLAFVFCFSRTDSRGKEKSGFVAASPSDGDDKGEEGGRGAEEGGVKGVTAA